MGGKLLISSLLISGRFLFHITALIELFLFILPQSFWLDLTFLTPDNSAPSLSFFYVDLILTHLLALKERLKLCIWKRKGKNGGIFVRTDFQVIFSL